MDSQNEHGGHQYNFSNWTATANDIVLSWLAFRELLAKGSVVVGVGPSQIVMSLLKRGWSRTVLGVELPLKDEQIIERMSGNPHDFCVAYDAGVDILGSPSYHCIMPWRLPELIDNFHPDQAAIHSGLSSFESGKLYAEQVKLAREAVEEVEANAVHSRVKVSPFLLTNPIKWFFTAYGIDAERVYARKTIGGLFTYNRGSSHPAHLIQTVRAEGNFIVGKVIFRDETADVVTWDRVLFPNRKKHYAETVVGEHRKANTRSEPSVSRTEKKCPICAEMVLMEAKRCKHCHSDLVS